MDFIRTAYTTKFKPWQDDPTEIEVRWFRCPDNAKSVPMPNIYSSGLWDDPKSSRVTIGDVYPQQRRWNGGENLAGYLGLAPCGPPQAFNTGGVHGRDPSIVTDASGVAPCCKTVRLLGVGGLGLGGAALFNNQVVWSGGKGLGGSWRVATGPVFAWTGGKGIGGTFVTSTGPTFAWTGGKGIGGHFVEVPDVAFEWSGGKGLGGSFEVAAGPAERWSGGKGLGGAWITVEGIGYRWSGGKGLGGSFEVAAGPAERWSGGKGLGGSFEVAAGPAERWSGGKGLGGAWITVEGIGYRWSGGKGLGGSFQIAAGPAERWSGGKGLGGAWVSAPGPAYPWTGGTGSGGGFVSSSGPSYPWTGGAGSGGSFPSGAGPSVLWSGGKGIGGTFLEQPIGGFGVQNIWNWESKVITGNAQSNNNQTAAFGGIQLFQQPPANGDTLEYAFLMPAGTWTWHVLFDMSNNRGMIDHYIDGVLIQSGLDTYFASDLYNQTASVAFSAGFTGVHKLRSVVNGKNASSSNYYWTPLFYWFTP